MLFGQTHKFMHAIRRLVRKANVADLALFDQAIQGVELLVDRQRLGIFGRIKIHHAKGWHMAQGPMDLVEVNDIRLQAFQ